jgi:ribonuclease Z
LFELVFLGTSASAPSIKRGLSSLVVKHGEHRFMIDCGEGTQRQILKSGIGFKRLNHILLTHGHLDHILGLAGLISTFMRWEAIEEINIYGRRHTMERVDDLMNRQVLRGAQTPMPIRLLDIKPGLIIETEDFAVHAFQVEHRGSSSLGYRFEEFPRRPFLPEKAEALGIAPGPWRKDLVRARLSHCLMGDVLNPSRCWAKNSWYTVWLLWGFGKPERLLEHIRGAARLCLKRVSAGRSAMAQEFGHTTAEPCGVGKKAGGGS